VAVQSLPVFDGAGVLVRALVDLSSLLHRRKRNEAATDSSVDENEIGIPLVLSFCSKGSLTDRTSAVQALMEVVGAVRLWGPLSEVAQLHAGACAYVDELQKELEAEEREPGEAVPKRYRGKPTSPAEECLNATLDYWASTLQQCRREVEDEGDLEPPEKAEMTDFVRAGLLEFSAGSLTMRLGVVRLWKHVFSHFIEEKIPMHNRLENDVCAGLIAAVQDASLDQRSERLRRPAIEFAAALVKDTTSGGGREVFTKGLAAAVAAEAGSAAPRTVPLADWLLKLDPTTADLCKEQLDLIRPLSAP